MLKKKYFILLVFLSFLFFFPVIADANPAVKISVFNFSTFNMEAAGYGTTVTNMLLTSLESSARFDVIGRKKLEAFLRLNDLQQNDNLKNVVYIGNRLGLYAIVVGTVAKKGSIITIKCEVIRSDQKKVILNTRSKSIGDAGLISETGKLSALITQAITNSLNRQGKRKKRGLQKPVNIEARSSGSSRIYLSWKNPPGRKAAGYKIFRSLSKMGPFAKIAQVKKPEYLDQYLEIRTIYYYKIRSYDSRGRQSGFSDIIPVETAPTPGPPIILSTDSHVKSIKITWAPSPAESGDPHKLKGYKLYRAKVEGGPYHKVANILGRGIRSGQQVKIFYKLLKVSYVDKGLADGEDYYYKVTAYNVKDLESDFSAPVKGTSIPIVYNFSARGGMIRETELVWDQPGSFHIKGYYVYRSTNENTGFNKIKKIDNPFSSKKKQVRFIDDQGLGDKITYYYYVTAFEEKDAETSPSVTVSSVTRGKPPVPEGLQAKSGMARKVALTWKANDEKEVKGYRLHRSHDVKGPPSITKDLSGREKGRFVDTKLEDNTAYCYRITSYNKVNVESVMSDAICATTKPRPKKPKGLKGVKLQVRKTPLKWTPNSEKDIVLYYIYRSSDEDRKFSRIAETSGKTNYIDEGLENGHEYQYKIQAEDKDKLKSDFSDIMTIRTKPKPKAPGELEVRSEGGKTRLRWTKNTEADISHYIIYEKILFFLKKVKTVTSNSFTISGLPPGKKKTYVVKAVDKDGLESEPSREIQVVVK